MKIQRFMATLVVGLVIAMPAGAAEPSPSAGAKAADVVELGNIPPSGPFQLWTSMNRVLPEYAMLKGGAELKARVEGLSATYFEGKTPADVLAQTAEYRATLEALRAQLNLPEVQIYKDPLGRTVTPGVVFVNSGYIMDATVRTYHTASDKPDVSLGGFYDVPVIAGKTPSDVFGLVHLATKRLQLITGS